MRVRAAKRRSSPSTAALFPRSSSEASCSATRAARSPARAKRALRASSSRPTAAPCSSTKSPRCRSTCRAFCCDSWRTAWCRASAARSSSSSTCALSPPPTRIYGNASTRTCSASTCTFASTCCISNCRRCAIAPTIWSCLSSTSLPAYRDASERTCAPQTRPSSSCSPGILGPETCASCATSWSVAST